MKKALVILLTACMLLSITACGPSEENASSAASGSSTMENIESGDADAESGTDVSGTQQQTSGSDASNTADGNDGQGGGTTGGNDGQGGGTTGGNDGQGGGTTTPTPSTGLDLRTAKFPGVTLKRIVWYDLSDEEKQMVKDWEAKTGAKVQDIKVNYENIQDRIKQSIAAKDPIDLGFLYGAFFPTDVIANMYQPVNAYLKSEYLLDTNKISEGGFDLAKMDAYKWKNNYYGFSSYWDVDMLVLFYRKDVFSDYGLKDPNELAKAGNWNWDTFYEAASTIQKGGEINGYSNGPDGKGGHQNVWVLSAGSTPVTSSSTKPTVNFGDTKLREGMEFYQKLSYGAGAVLSDDMAFQDGKAAMFIGGLYDVTKLMTSNSVPDRVKKNWDIAPIPLSKNNKSGKYPTDWLKATGIVNGSKNQDAAASFALFKSKYKGDNQYDEYFTSAQISRYEPFFKNITYANYAYGTLITKYGQLFQQIADGGDITQILNANKSVFQSEIDKTIR